MPISLILMGHRLQNARKKRHLTQQQLAEAVNISVGHLSKIERGIKTISLEKLTELCDALNISIEWVLTGAVNPKNAEHNRQFGMLAAKSSSQTVAVMLSICSQIVKLNHECNQKSKEPDGK